MPLSESKASWEKRIIPLFCWNTQKAIVLIQNLSINKLGIFTKSAQYRQ